MNASLLKKALPHLIAIVAFLLVAVIYCKPALDGKVVSQSDMIGYKGMAQQSFEYREKYGHYPLWTESTFSGMPAYNIAMEARPNIVPGMISPLLTLGLPKPVSFFFMACLTFYFLALVLGLNPWIAALSALAYAWSTYDPIIVRVGHETKMMAIGYAPGMIAAFILVLRKYYMWGAVALAFFSSMLMNTTHLQVIYYTLLSLGILTLCYLIDAWKQKQLKPMIISLVIAAIVVIIGFATIAVVNLPVQEYAKETMRGGRSELTDPNKKAGETGGGLTKEYAFTWSYGIPETFTLLIPRSAGGGSDGKEVGDDSKAAEKLSEIGYGEQASSYANYLVYWGAQEQGTSGPVYLGAIICFLFFLGLIYTKGWLKWWLVSISVLGILLAWGKNFPGFNYFIFDHLPFYNKFRAPTLALVLPQFAFPLLGGLGLQQLFFGDLSKDESWKKFKKAVLITGGVLLAVIGYYLMADYSSKTGDARFKDGLVRQMSQGRQLSPQQQQQANEMGNGVINALKQDRQSIFGSDLIRSILLIAAAVVLIGLYLKDKVRQKQILLGGLVLLTAFDLLAVGRRYLNEESFVDPADFEASLNPTAVDQQISSDPEKGFRVFDATGDPFQMSVPTARTSYHHNSVGGYSAAKMGLYQDLIEHQLSKFNMRVYDMLNTKYIIQENPANRQPVAQINPGAYGPCWLVKSIDYVADGNAEMKALDSTNTKDTVIIQNKYKDLVKFSPVPDSTASIKLIDNLLDKINYKFSAKTNQFAVFSEIYYDKGWNAYVDGQKTDYLRVDYVLRGMSIPAGDHNIEFRFEPRSYTMGNMITTWTSLIVWLSLLGAIFIEWRKRSRKTA